jgi:hypothetical protein
MATTPSRGHGRPSRPPVATMADRSLNATVWGHDSHTFPSANVDLTLSAFEGRPRRCGRAKGRRRDRDASPTGAPRASPRKPPRGFCWTSGTVGGARAGLGFFAGPKTARHRPRRQPGDGHGRPAPGRQAAFRHGGRCLPRPGSRPHAGRQQAGAPALTSFGWGQEKAQARWPSPARRRSFSELSSSKEASN